MVWNAAPINNARKRMRFLRLMTISHLSVARLFCRAKVAAWVVVRAHDATTTGHAKDVYSLSSPTGGEGRGEEAESIECPSPRPFPHSFLAGRGSRFLVIVSCALVALTM